MFKFARCNIFSVTFYSVCMSCITLIKWVGYARLIPEVKLVHVIPDHTKVQKDLIL